MSSRKALDDLASVAVMGTTGIVRESIMELHAEVGKDLALLESLNLKDETSVGMLGSHGLLHWWPHTRNAKKYTRKFGFTPWKEVE